MSIISAQGYIGDTFYQLGAFSVPNIKYQGDAPFTLTPPTSNSPGGWTFTSSDPNLISISGTTATVSTTNNGTCTITATQDWAPYQGANVATAQCMVLLPAADPYFANVSLLINGDSSPVVDVKGNPLTTTVGTVAPVRSTTTKLFGSGSVFCNGGGYKIPYTTAFNLTSIDWTMECWFNPSQIAANACILSKDTYGSNFDWCMLLLAGGKTFEVATSGTTVTFIPTIGQLVIGTWYHLAMVRSGTTITVYLNGVSCGSKVMNLSNSSVSFFTVGCESWNNANTPFKGYLDDIRITKGVARYTANFTPPAACPVY